MEDGIGSTFQSNRRSLQRDGDEAAVMMPEMQISIDSQSFVNLGQLMGSRHGSASAAAGGGNSNSLRGLSDDLGASCLAERVDDLEGLRDFDQIFHPRAEQGGSASGASWASRELFPPSGAGAGGGVDHDEDDDDDDDSLLPALPSRSCTPGSPRDSDMASLNRPSSFPVVAEPGWAEEDFATSALVDGGVLRRGRLVSAGSSSACSNGAPRIDGTTESDTKVAVVALMTLEATRCASLDNGYIKGKSTASSGRAVVRTQPCSEIPASPAAAAAAAGGSSNTPPLLRDSWLHVPPPMEDGEVTAAGVEPKGTLTEEMSAGAAASAGGGSADAGIDPRQRQRYHDAAAAAAIARRAAASALADCGECFLHAVSKTAALVSSPVQQLAHAVKQQAVVGAEACAMGQQAVVKAVDNVPQAPVRVWLGRLAGSLVLGVILGAVSACYALPRSIAGSAPAKNFAAGADAGAVPGTDAASAWWDMAGETSAREWEGAGGGGGGGGAEQGFEERVNKAMFAARVGEAAAQQVLLDEVRNILAATGRSGGISAEQILRHFNARRFAEASKAWSAAEAIDNGNGSGSGKGAGVDPVDAPFFAFSATPTTSPAHPSASFSSSSSSPNQHQQQSSIPFGAAPATECAGGASGSAFCYAEGGGSGDSSRAYFASRAKAFGGDSVRQHYRRPCSGGWVC